jgi:energy-coupling factor transport system permease protein
MIRDITLGQYYPVDSPIHRLDPRVKLAMVFAYIISLFFGKSLLLYTSAAICLMIITKLSTVPVKFMLKGLKAIMILIIFTVVFNLLITPGEHLIVEFWIFKVTVEGLISAASMAFRLILLIVGSSLLTLTTSPIDLTDAIERVLKPLEKIRVPAHEIAMMMTIALRFIPILLEETDKIMKAQMARGADFESGGIFKRAKSLIPLLVPLFISAFRRADDLALAMEARCYRGGEGRTRMNALVYTAKDKWAYVMIFIYLVMMILLGWLFSQVMVYGISI